MRAPRSEGDAKAPGEWTERARESTGRSAPLMLVTRSASQCCSVVLTDDPP